MPTGNEIRSNARSPLAVAVAPGLVGDRSFVRLRLLSRMSLSQRRPFPSGSAALWRLYSPPRPSVLIPEASEVTASVLRDLADGGAASEVPPYV
jgi:hypothetical protein